MALFSHLFSQFIRAMCSQISATEAEVGFPVGPPYLMHTRDWARVIDLWVRMCPKVYAGHAGILAEMYGFCIAAAHIGCVCMKCLFLCCCACVRVCVYYLSRPIMQSEACACFCGGPHLAGLRI